MKNLFFKLSASKLAPPLICTTRRRDQNDKAKGEISASNLVEVGALPVGVVVELAQESERVGRERLSDPLERLLLEVLAHRQPSLRSAVVAQARPPLAFIIVISLQNYILPEIFRAFL